MGASRRMLCKFSEQTGLKFEDYIFHVGQGLKRDLPNESVEYLDLIGLVTYNKHK